MMTQADLHSADTECSHGRESEGADLSISETLESEAEIRRRVQIANNSERFKSVPKAYADAANGATLRGHGILAEKAEHILDSLQLKNTEHVGDSNLLNGADRIVDGVFIQSKYCSSGRECIRQCFDELGNFKYVNNNNENIMQIEVPRDLYEDAVRAMESRIQKGGVPGVTDPSEARRIVRAGRLTYQQARNLARAGSIESLSYDAATGAVTAGCAVGLSAAVYFAQAMWQGDEVDKAARDAAVVGLQVGGTSLAIHILSLQLARTGFERVLSPSTQVLAQRLGPKLSAALIKGFTGKSLTGAAASGHLAKLLRGNVATAVVATCVLSSVDCYRFFSGSISGSQAFKNVTITAAGVAGGMGGAAAGAAAGGAIGTMLLPGIGSTAGAWIGGVIGGLFAGSTASLGAKSFLDVLIEDDAQAMAKILEETMAEQAEINCLSEMECKGFVEGIVSGDLALTLRMIYQSDDKKVYCLRMCSEIVKDIVKKRLSIPIYLERHIISAVAESDWSIDEQMAVHPEVGSGVSEARA